MFTGLIEAVGEVLWIRASDQGTQLQISTPQIAVDAQIGDSISVNGCCLTVSSIREEQLTFDLLEETLSRTNLGKLRRGDLVNLERALAANARLGGHFVQGHVDCTAEVISFAPAGTDYRLEIVLPNEFAHYVAYKGSIAVNGISLTVAEAMPESFVVWIIPHTRRATNLAALNAGAVVNLEFDLLAKYLARMLDRYIIRE